MPATVLELAVDGAAVEGAAVAAIDVGIMLLVCGCVVLTVCGEVLACVVVAVPAVEGIVVTVVPPELCKVAS